HPAPTVLAFHKVSSRLSYGVTNYSPCRLRQLLTVLKTDGSLGNTVLTFDDGYAHLADVLPDLMDDFGLQPLVFVPTAWIGRTNRWDYSHAFRSEPHLDRDTIAGLSNRGVVFGSHGHTHRSLEECTPEELKRELTVSRDILEDITGRPVTLLSYPFGRLNRAILQAVEQCGYTRAYGMHFPDPADAALATGRVAVYGFDTPAIVRAKLRGNGGVYRCCRGAASLANRLSGGTILLNRLRGQSVSD
ncbi:MAG: polysaccharide deacetylase family protein, partial [candidate division Zixibacteria bacterium]|nr:polysaccharide deacetylase family protein [candidate division Zixibacteria bacterium]